MATKQAAGHMNGSTARADRACATRHCDREGSKGTPDCKVHDPPRMKAARQSPPEESNVTPDNAAAIARLAGWKLSKLRYPA
jgi:hypothetical protein